MARLLRTWIEISSTALVTNVRSFRQRLGPNIALCPIIKSNAYGHGVQAVVRALAHQSIWGFGVAYGPEALALRQLGWPGRILVLSSWHVKDLPELIQRQIELVAWDRRSLNLLNSWSGRLGQPARVHVKIDTGTSRIGILPDEVEAFREKLHYSKNIMLEGIFTHLADAEGRDLRFARQQHREFSKHAQVFPAPMKHFAATAAALRIPQMPANMVRLGIGTYGLWPSAATRRAVKNFQLRPVLQWFSTIQQCKTVTAGTTVGYDRTLRLRKKTRLAIIPIGYADGYDRRASNRSAVIIHERRCPVLGRVSMNLIMVNVSRIPDVRPGAPVTIIGPGITADDLASDWRTINYEVIGRLSPEIPRVLRP